MIKHLGEKEYRRKRSFDELLDAPIWGEIAVINANDDWDYDLFDGTRHLQDIRWALWNADMDWEPFEEKIYEYFPPEGREKYTDEEMRKLEELINRFEGSDYATSYAKILTLITGRKFDCDYWESDNNSEYDMACIYDTTAFSPELISEYEDAYWAEGVIEEGRKRRNKRTKAEGVRRKMEDMAENDIVRKIMDYGYDEEDARDYAEEASMYDMEVFWAVLDDTMDADHALDIAERIDDLDEDERAILGAYMDYEMSDYEEALDVVERGDYTTYYGCDNMRDVAYEVIDQVYGDEIPTDLAQRYFDYEGYGRDLGIEGRYCYSADFGGYIEFFN